MANYIGDPPGTLKPFAGNAAPGGWLLADGSAVSRTVYADLFAAIGTLHGSGDGSTTFNLPDTLGRAIVGKGTHADVTTVGANEGLAASARSPKHNSTNNLTLPNHTHTYNAPGPGVVIFSSGSQSVVQPGSSTNTSNPTSNPNITGTVGPGGTRPTDTGAYLVANYIIKF